MIDPAKVALFIPVEIIEQNKFKLKLFERIGAKLGRVIRADVGALGRLPPDVTPVVGCTPDLRPLIDEWKATGRQFVYWDRGYARRVFATDLPVGENGGYYRWHINSFQLEALFDAKPDRWASLKIEPWQWSRGGKHIVVAEPPRTYQRFHKIEGWTERTMENLKKLTDRPIIVRDKEQQRFGRKLHEDLKGAHALVTHGSIAAVEAVIMGCPVFVDKCSAAALVGKTDMSEIESPVYPDREKWLHSLAYCQFNEQELVDGTLWRLIR